MLFIHQLTMLKRILNNGQTFLYVPAEKEERKDEIPFLVVILPPLLAKKSYLEMIFCPFLDHFPVCHYFHHGAAYVSLFTIIVQVQVFSRGA